MKKFIFQIIYIIFTPFVFSQNTDILSLSEYLSLVKKYHPIVKQANLIINESEANLLKARGTFDPKLEVDYDRKKFKNTEYFDKLNATFKIPTWYGITLKGNFEENSGAFLNPEDTVGDNGLYNVGVSVSLARGLLINERMATLKQAKLFKDQAKLDNQLLVNEILYNAARSYFQWLKTFKEKIVYEEFLENAKLRLQGIQRGYSLGENPAIDTTEAKIAYNNRKLSLEKANLNHIKASLELSNFLWINDIPVEIQENIFPDLETIDRIDNTLQITNIDLGIETGSHPKLQSLGLKYKRLEVDRRLKQNNLLPEISLEYNFLSETPEIINSFNTTNYKTGIAINFPLFLRKERAELKLASYKLQAINFDRQALSLTLKNKFNAIQQEINSYDKQIAITNTIVTDYTLLLKGEERKLEIGESSLFLVNSRESNLIENKLKAIELENLFLNSKSKLFNVLGI